MANYDFQNLLSPLDFEHLVRDLLSKDLGIELSAFTEGKDGGIANSSDIDHPIPI